MPAVISGTGDRNRMLGQENQRAAIPSWISGVQMLTSRMKPSTTISSGLGEMVGPVLQRPFRAPDQPGAAQQGIAGNQRHPAHHRERRQPVEHAAGEVAALHLKALDEGAKRDALDEGRDQRAEVEGDVPQKAARVGLEAELEGDAAEDQGDQHRPAAAGRAPAARSRRPAERPRTARRRPAPARFR